MKPALQFVLFFLISLASFLAGYYVDGRKGEIKVLCVVDTQGNAYTAVYEVTNKRGEKESRWEAQSQTGDTIQVTITAQPRKP